MGRVGRLHSFGKELGTEEGEVFLDGKDLGFCVKMANRAHLHAARGDTEGAILDGLEFFNGG